MTQGPVRIITDSAAGLPPALTQEYGIQVIPYPLIWDGQVYLDGRDLSPTEFYRRFRSDSTYPTTTMPTYGQFVEAYQQAVESGASAIVGVFVSGKLTSTVNMAQQAAREVSIPVYVIDSLTATTSEGFIALAAARAARRGASVEQIVSIAEAYRERVGAYFALETLEHLNRGGRIGEAATLLGTRLRVQPVVRVAEGLVRPVGVARTRQRALDLLLARVGDVVGDAPIRASVLHADVLEEAQQFAERVQSTFHCIEFFISDFTPVMGAHAGPGVIGIAYCIEEVP